jgi:hypothetical protein
MGKAASCAGLGALRSSGKDCDYYVNSVSGNDGNIGRGKGTAFASLGALSGKMKDGIKIGLACGSTWRETLALDNTMNNARVKAYGSGNKPRITGRNAISAGAWSKTAGRTNVYQQASIS